jgi:hypothetical protein
MARAMQASGQSRSPSLAPAKRRKADAGEELATYFVEREDEHDGREPSEMSCTFTTRQTGPKSTLRTIRQVRL